MSLEVVVGDEAPTGAESTGMRPITEGERIVAVKSGGGFFDSLGRFGGGVVDTVSDGASALMAAHINKELNELNGAAATQDTTGSVADQPGATQAPPASAGFFEQNKMALMVGGGVLAAVAIILAVKK